jgi:hypothetical protein
MEWASSDAGDYPPSAHATAISGEPHDRADASESLVGLDADSGIAKARPGSGKPARSRCLVGRPDAPSPRHARAAANPHTRLSTLSETPAFSAFKWRGTKVVRRLNMLRSFCRGDPRAAHPEIRLQGGREKA